RFTARRRTHVQNAHKHPALTIHGVPMRGAAVDTNFADVPGAWQMATKDLEFIDRKSTRLNSSHVKISYAVFCLKKKSCSVSQMRTATDSASDEVSSARIFMPRV